MIPGELLKLISGGENNTVEFKKSTTDITKDVYESICAFSNRDGGHVFLGIKDNGVILGIQQDRIDQMKKDFVTAINNENKYFPRCIYPLSNLSRRAGISCIFAFRSGLAFADVMGVFMTGITKQISILPTMRDWFIDYMRESRIPIMLIKCSRILAVLNYGRN